MSDESRTTDLPHGLRLRPAGPDDVDAVVALVQRAYRGDASRAGWTTEADLLDGQRTDADAVRELVGEPRSAVLLLVGGDDAPVACCHVAARTRAEGMAGDDVVGYLGMLAVDPGRQGDGTGRALLAAASRHAAQELDARVLEMTVIAQRAELIAWYERQGWERTGERRPFPYGDDRFGRPRRDDLEFVVLAKEAAEV